VSSGGEFHACPRPGDGSCCVHTYFTHQQNVLWSLGVSESCRTRITGWSNCRVYWTDVVAFRCTWEYLGAPGSTLNHCRAVSEKHLLWECCWCAWKSYCILIYVSMYLYSYLSTHGISGLAASGDSEQLEVRLKMTIE